jgi:hypothetical protein
MLTRLETVVAGLNAGSISPDDEFLPERDGRPPEPLRQRALPSEPVPFVALPRRTTPGGDFGPSVRAKLVAEALSKETW